jgi:hypothetical protein
MKKTILALMTPIFLSALAVVAHAENPNCTGREALVTMDPAHAEELILAVGAIDSIPLLGHVKFRSSDRAYVVIEIAPGFDNSAGADSFRVAELVKMIDTTEKHRFGIKKISAVVCYGDDAGGGGGDDAGTIGHDGGELDFSNVGTIGHGRGR